MTLMTTAFDYQAAGLPADAAARLEVYAERVEAGHQNAMAAMMQAAEALANARQEMSDDQSFGRWREARLPWLAAPMASQYLNVWRRYGTQAGLNASQNRLFQTSATVLRLLAQPAADGIREVAEARLDAGEKVTVADVERWKAEARAAREDADRAKQQAERALSERDDATGQVAALRDSITLKEREAYERAKSDLEAQIQTATKRAAEAEAAAQAAQARVEDAARAARDEERRAALDRHDQDAQAAVERKRADLADLERKASDAAEQAQRSHAAREQLEADIQRHREYLARTQAAEHEWPVMLGDVEAFTSATTTMMHALHGYDYGPDARVTKAMDRAAQMARQMADALDTFCADRLPTEAL